MSKPGVVDLASYGKGSLDANLTAYFAQYAGDSVDRRPWGGIFGPNPDDAEGIWRVRVPERVIPSNMGIVGPGGVMDAQVGEQRYSVVVKSEGEAFANKPWLVIGDKGQVGGNAKGRTMNVQISGFNMKQGKTHTFIETRTDRYGNPAQFWRSCIEDIGWDGGFSMLGRRGAGTNREKFLLSASNIGQVNIGNHFDVAWFVGGSDSLIGAGKRSLCDSGLAFAPVDSTGKKISLPHIILDNLAATPFNNMYLTAEGPWRGIEIRGGSKYARQMSFRDVIVEGRNADAPCTGGPLVDITGTDGTGPTVYFSNLQLTNWAGPAGQGYLRSTNAHVELESVVVGRAAVTPETEPVVVTKGARGRTFLGRALPTSKGGAWTGYPGKPRYRDAEGGVTVDHLNRWVRG